MSVEYTKAIVAATIDVVYCETSSSRASVNQLPS